MKFKKTKIIATISEMIGDEETLGKLVDAGMNVTRINMSHSNHEYAKMICKNARAITAKTGHQIGVLVDTAGPEIRIGKMENDAVDVVEGQIIKIVTEDVVGNGERFTVSYKQLARDLQVGNEIVLHDGAVTLTVIDIPSDNSGDVICRVNNANPIKTKKAVLVPGVELKMAFLSAKDIADIEMACDIDADYVALSFVNTASDVLAAREILKHKGNTHIQIICKIESVLGIENIDDIIAVTDGIMVARGDLGVEMPIEKLPRLQKLIIKKVHAVNKFVIVATEMLASMENNPRPTRAEISDVANAVLDGTDAIMLSGETSIGKYPVLTVATMAKIAKTTEEDIDYDEVLKRARKAINNTSITNLISRNVAETSNLLGTKAIVAATRSGNTARNISKFRPEAIVIATSPNERTVRSLVLNWGVFPYLVSEFKTTDQIVENAIEVAKKVVQLEEKDTVIITGGFPAGGVVETNFMKVKQF